MWALSFSSLGFFFSIPLSSTLAEKLVQGGRWGKFPTTMSPDVLVASDARAQRERKKRTAEIYAERKHILYYPFSKYGDQKPFGYCHITNITLLATRIIPFDCCLFLSYLSYSDERKGCVANSQSSWKN